MATIETIEIVSNNETGFKVINKCDLMPDDIIYDPNKIEVAEKVVEIISSKQHVKKKHK